jgi:hypothetical protein
MVDTTTDTSHVEQMSIVLSYVSIFYIRVKVRESFLGFISVLKGKAKAADLTEQILTFLNELNLDINDCTSQSYDGAAVMKCHYSGVQKRIKVVNSLATYVHCSARSLNLVIADSAKVPSEIITSFAVIQRVFTFFSSCNRRWELLTKATDQAIANEPVDEGDPTEDVREEEPATQNRDEQEQPDLNSIHTKIHHSGTSFGPMRVKQVSIIRCEGRITLVRALRKGLPRVINILNESQATSNDGNEIFECEILECGSMQKCPEFTQH